MIGIIGIVTMFIVQIQVLVRLIPQGSEVYEAVESSKTES